MKMETIQEIKNELKSIVENAPEGATHIETLASKNFYYLRKVKQPNSHSYEWFNNEWLELKTMSGFIRSLADIKQIIEQQEKIDRLETIASGLFRQATTG